MQQSNKVNKHKQAQLTRNKALQKKASPSPQPVIVSSPHRVIVGSTPSSTVSTLIIPISFSSSCTTSSGSKYVTPSYTQEVSGSAVKGRYYLGVSVA